MTSPETTSTTTAERLGYFTDFTTTHSNYFSLAHTNNIYGIARPSLRTNLLLWGFLNIQNSHETATAHYVFSIGTYNSLNKEVVSKTRESSASTTHGLYDCIVVPPQWGTFTGQELVIYPLFRLYNSGREVLIRSGMINTMCFSAPSL